MHTGRRKPDLSSTAAIDLLDMAALPWFIAPSQRQPPERQEHGPTIS